MDIACYFLKTDGTFEKALVSKDMLLHLIVSLKDKNKETIHFEGKSIEAEGVFIPSRKTKHGIMALPNIRED